MNIKLLVEKLAMKGKISLDISIYYPYFFSSSLLYILL